jgi:hypothetical protein
MVVSQHILSDLCDRIRSAIAEELKVSSSGLPFRVIDVIKQSGILTLELEPQDLRCTLDETMEDGRLGWGGESRGSADSVSVLPDISYINAVMTSGRPPSKGDIIFVIPRVSKSLSPHFEIAKTFRNALQIGRDRSQSAANG